MLDPWAMLLELEKALSVRPVINEQPDRLSPMRIRKRRTISVNKSKSLYIKLIQLYQMCNLRAIADL